MPGPGLSRLFSDLVKERCASVSESPFLFNAFFRRKFGLACSCGYPQNVVEVEFGLWSMSSWKIGGCR